MFIPTILRLFFYSFVLVLCSMTMVYGSSAVAEELDEDDKFYVCKEKYALCTTAACTPIDGTNALNCVCDIKKGFSVGAQACEAAKESSPGTIYSRYAPIKDFVVCNNDREWAYCLDKPCIIDKKTGKANCTCSTQKGGLYVITTDKYTPETCETGIISSATVDSLMEVTEFLKSSKELPPHDFKILNKMDK